MEEKKVVKVVEEPAKETAIVKPLFDHYLHYKVVVNGLDYTFIAPYAGDHLTAKQAAFSFLGQIEIIAERHISMTKEKEAKEAAEKKESEKIN